MSKPSEKPKKGAKETTKKELGKELEELAEELPTKEIEVPTQIRFAEEAQMKLLDYRFVISMVMVIGFLVLLGIPLARSEEDLLKTIASILAGPVGAVLGYYFGVRRREET